MNQDGPDLKLGFHGIVGHRQIEPQPSDHIIANYNGVDLPAHNH